MSEVFWLSEAQIARLRPFFPRARGKPRVDDRRVLSGIIYIQRNGLMWKDAPRDYVPHKTLYNRWKRWSRMGVFATIMTELAAEAQQTECAFRGIRSAVPTTSGQSFRGIRSPENRCRIGMGF